MATNRSTSSTLTRAQVPGLQTDEDGFLLDPGAWSREASRILAEIDGVSPLGADHWAVILYLREHYLAHGTLPVMRHVCRVSHLDRDAVRKLFGGCRAAWRVAGLPNPGEEAKAYMD